MVKLPHKNSSRLFLIKRPSNNKSNKNDITNKDY